MRISDWSSDVCSSDLQNACDGEICCCPGDLIGPLHRQERQYENRRYRDPPCAPPEVCAYRPAMLNWVRHSLLPLVGISYQNKRIWSTSGGRNRSVRRSYKSGGGKVCVSTC